MAGMGKENQLAYRSYNSLNNEGRLRERNRRKKTMEDRQEYGSNQARIKDLCPNDKARIKQLVEDLARLGTEKEQIECDWKQERSDLEGKLSLLRKRQALLLREKSDILLILNNAHTDTQFI
uniref:Uncharacterized protein n=1 Tax=Amphimedon queenslandica TaxID=400682 RepID=A0A1X7SJU8_AMPQE